MAFRRQIAQGVGWSTLASVLRQGFSFIGSIILARLLLPDEFGLVAIALTITNLLWVFGEFGLWQALMRWDGDIEVAANVTFILNFIISAFITLGVFLAAPFIAITFFDNAALIPILQILSFTVVLNAVERVPACLMEKALNFKARTQIELLSQLLYVIVSIILATIGFGVWALVGGIFAQTLSKLILTYRQTHFRFSWRFDFAVAKTLITFGQYLVYTAFIVSISRNIDQILVARFVDFEQVGFYTVSFTAGRIIMDMLKQSLGRTMLPAYSAVQDSTRKLQTLYQKSVQLSCFLVFILATLVIWVAPTVVPLLYSATWEPMVPYIYIWMVRSCLAATYFLTGHLLVVLQRPASLTWVSLMQIVVTVVGAYGLGPQFGGIGIALANTGSVFIAAIIMQFLAVKYAKLNYASIVDMLLKPIIVLVGSVFVGLIIRYYLPNSLISLGITVFTVAVVYAISSYLMIGKDLQTMMNFQSIRSLFIKWFVSECSIVARRAAYIW